MAYDNYMADRLRNLLREKSIYFEEKKMMGGLCFMVDEKMCFGLMNDKYADTPVLMCRVGPKNYERALQKPHCSEMNLTGRAMKGFVFVSAEGMDTENDLEEWVQLCLDYNPLAKKSRKKK